MKKIVVLLLSVAMAAGSAVFAYADDNIADFEFENGVIVKYNGSEENIIIPDEITSQAVITLGSSAFADNKTVKSIHIPSGVTQIWENNLADYGTYTFWGTDNLESITVDESNPVYKSIDGVLYDRNGTLLWYPQNKAGESFAVPSDVSSIRTLALEKCNNLKQVYINNDEMQLGIWSIGGNIAINSRKGGNAVQYARENGNTLKYIADMGDADASGSITANDAALVLAKAINSGLDTDVCDFEKVYDVNGDNVITAADCSYIIERTLDLDRIFPAENNKTLTFADKTWKRGASDDSILKYNSGMQSEITVIKSRAELENYYDTHSDAINKDGLDNALADFAGENVFDESMLVMIYYPQGCLYTESVVKDVSVVNGKLTVTMEIYMPEVMCELIDFAITVVKVDKDTVFDSCTWKAATIWNGSVFGESELTS